MTEASSEENTAKIPIYTNRWYDYFLHTPYLTIILFYIVGAILFHNPLIQIQPTALYLNGELFKVEQVVLHLVSHKDAEHSSTNSLFVLSMFAISAIALLIPPRGWARAFILPLIISIITSIILALFIFDSSRSVAGMSGINWYFAGFVASGHVASSISLLSQRALKRLRRFQSASTVRMVACILCPTVLMILSFGHSYDAFLGQFSITNSNGVGSLYHAVGLYFGVIAGSLATLKYPLTVETRKPITSYIDPIPLLKRKV